MKKALRIFAIFLACIVLLLGCGAVFIQLRGVPNYPVEAPGLTITADSARIAEGKRLVSMTCQHCHGGADGKLSGRYMFEQSGPFGLIYSANLTQHPDAGIGRYTDGELLYMLRTGIKRNGEFAPPFMPRFNQMSDDDLHAIIAFLRSGDPQVQSTETWQPKWQPTFLAKALANFVIKPVPFATAPVTVPDPANQIATGRYLATARYHCYGCHSPSFQDVDLFDPEKTPGYFSGGNPMQNEEMNPIYTANLTPDPETGLGRWTEAQFLDAVRFGKHPSGRALRMPMAPYSAMRDDEARAIWAYLQTVPATHHPVDRKLPDSAR